MVQQSKDSANDGNERVKRVQVVRVEMIKERTSDIKEPQELSWENMVSGYPVYSNQGEA